MGILRPLDFCRRPRDPLVDLPYDQGDVVLLVAWIELEPPSSWSRTRLDQTKSVELTAFTCAFPPLIWATWATKYQ